MISCLAVGMGGFLGAVARYLIGLLPLKAENGFPMKTFLINVAGSFAIGIIAALASKNHTFSPTLVLFLKVGICGGFTTFSSFALETTDLLQAGSPAIAILYAVSSMVTGCLAVILAQVLVS